MTVRVQFQLRDEVAQHLAEQAAERGVSRQAHVQDLIMAGAGSQWEGAVAAVLTTEAEANARPTPTPRPAFQPLSKDDQVKK